ncbi:MAG: hypothetical protein LBL98_01780 [Ruminococcus sp.]|jgi:hypothetical protein|nr:hypothetical protein [Ruminococcus sp.]
MTFINIVIVVIAYVNFSILIYFLRREKAIFSRKRTLILAVITGAVFAGIYPLWERSFGNSIQSVDLYVLLVFILTSLPAFFIYPGNPNKNLFFISTTTPLMVVGHGLGNLAEISLAPGSIIGRTVNLVVMTAVFAVIIAGLYFITRKKFPGLYENENPKLWRRLWIITLLMGFTQIAAGNVFTPNTFTPTAIIPSRLICLAGMAAILFIAGLAKRQAEESAGVASRAKAAEEAVKAKEKAYAEIVAQTEETSRLRHDTRQIFAAVGGLNEPGKEAELESYCLEVLAELRVGEELKV